MWKRRRSTVHSRSLVALDGLRGPVHASVSTEQRLEGYQYQWRIQIRKVRAHRDQLDCCRTRGDNIITQALQRLLGSNLLEFNRPQRIIRTAESDSECWILSVSRLQNFLGVRDGVEDRRNFCGA
jgi:hypothetical protein